MGNDFVNSSVINLFLKTAQHMDDDGFFEQADYFDGAFIKLSQTPLPLPNGQLPFPMSKGEPKMSDSVKKTLLKPKSVVNIEKYRTDINSVVNKLKKYPDTISVVKDPVAHGYDISNPSIKAKWESKKQQFISFASANKIFTAEQITKDVYNAIAFEIYSLSGNKIRVQRLPGPTPNSWATVSTNPKIQFLGDMGTSGEVIYIQKIVNIARAILNDSEMVKLCGADSLNDNKINQNQSNAINKDASPESNVQQQSAQQQQSSPSNIKPVVNSNSPTGVNFNYDKISSYNISDEILKHLKQGPVFDFLKNNINFQLANQIWRACARFHAIDISKSDAVGGVEQRIYSSICESIPNTVRSVCADFLRPLVTSFAQRTIYTKTDKPLVIYYKNALEYAGRYDQKAKLQIAASQESFVMLLINILSNITAYNTQELLTGMINFNKNSGLYEKNN